MKNNNEIIELLKENNRLLNQLIGLQVGLHSTFKIDLKPLVKEQDLLMQLYKPKTLKDLKEKIEAS